MWNYDSFAQYVDQLLELALKNDPAISAIINEEIGRIKISYPNNSKNIFKVNLL